MKELIKELWYQFVYIPKEIKEYRVQVAEFYTALENRGITNREWEYAMLELWGFAPNQYERDEAEKQWDKLRLIWDDKAKNNAKIKWADTFVALVIKGTSK